MDGGRREREGRETKVICFESQKLMTAPEQSADYPGIRRYEIRRLKWRGPPRLWALFHLGSVLGFRALAGWANQRFVFPNVSWDQTTPLSLCCNWTIHRLIDRCYS